MILKTLYFNVLTDSQHRYANIELERCFDVSASIISCMLGHVFSKWTWKFQDNHIKHIIPTPARLQRNLLRLKSNNIETPYKYGNDILLAESLSRLLICSEDDGHSPSSSSKLYINQKRYTRRVETKYSIISLLNIKTKRWTDTYRLQHSSFTRQHWSLRLISHSQDKQDVFVLSTTLK